MTSYAYSGFEHGYPTLSHNDFGDFFEKECRIRLSATTLTISSYNGKDLATWPYSTIRSFDCEGDLFRFTSGRRGPFGVGTYQFQFNSNIFSQFKESLSAVTGASFTTSYAKDTETQSNVNASLPNSVCASPTSASNKRYVTHVGGPASNCHVAIALAESSTIDFGLSRMNSTSSSSSTSSTFSSISSTSSSVSSTSSLTEEPFSGSLVKQTSVSNIRKPTKRVTHAYEVVDPLEETVSSATSGDLFTDPLSTSPLSNASSPSHLLCASLPTGSMSISSSPNVSSGTFAHHSSVCPPKKCNSTVPQPHPYEIASPSCSKEFNHHSRYEEVLPLKPHSTAMYENAFLLESNASVSVCNEDHMSNNTHRSVLVPTNYGTRQLLFASPNGGVVIYDVPKPVLQCPGQLQSYQSAAVTAYENISLLSPCKEASCRTREVTPDPQPSPTCSRDQDDSLYVNLSSMHLEHDGNYESIDHQNLSKNVVLTQHSNVLSLSEKLASEEGYELLLPAYHHNNCEHGSTGGTSFNNHAHDKNCYGNHGFQNGFQGSEEEENGYVILRMDIPSSSGVGRQSSECNILKKKTKRT